MFVLVSPDSGRSHADARAEVKDVQNLNQLHVEFRAVDDSSAGAALAAAGLGAVEDSYAWLDIAALRSAGGNDWVDAEGNRLRAHIVRS
jgi:hypothetical protein